MISDISGGGVMEKLTFKRQLFFGIVLIIAGNILAFTFRKGIFSL